MPATLDSLIQKALDQHIVDYRTDLPWVNQDGEVTDEARLIAWLESNIYACAPKPGVSIVLNEEALHRILGEPEFRVLVTSAAVSAILDTHGNIIDERIKARIEGTAYTPELNTFLAEKIRAIVSNEVGNYLRSCTSEIRRIAEQVVNEQMDASVKAAVADATNRLRKRLRESIDV